MSTHKIAECKLKLIKGKYVLEAVAEPVIHPVQIQGVFVDQWFLDLCAELPELKTYDCINDLYDELGEY